MLVKHSTQTAGCWLANTTLSIICNHSTPYSTSRSGDIENINRFKNAIPIVQINCNMFSYLFQWPLCVCIFQNLLAGALFGVSCGFPLTCLLTAIGATNCYCLSHLFGKKYIVKYFPGRLKNMQDKVRNYVINLQVSVPPRTYQTNF